MRSVLVVVPDVVGEHPLQVRPSEDEEPVEALPPDGSHPPLGIGVVRLHGNVDDVARRFNRTENVRPIAPTDPDFKRLFRIRNDAESINRGIDDSMYLRRAHSVGHRRQLVNLLGYALMVNSVALREHMLRRPAVA